MRIIGCFLIIGILFSYIPVFPMDECPEGNHMGNMKMDCGYLFHCPMIVDINISETSSLPPNGFSISIRTLLLMEELVHSIFHPPEYLSAKFIPQGMEGKKQLGAYT
jgi:hypothetical protein